MKQLFSLFLAFALSMTLCIPLNHARVQAAGGTSQNLVRFTQAEQEAGAVLVRDFPDTPGVITYLEGQGMEVKNVSAFTQNGGVDVLFDNLKNNPNQQCYYIELEIGTDITEANEIVRWNIQDANSAHLASVMIAGSRADFLCDGTYKAIFAGGTYEPASVNRIGVALDPLEHKITGYINGREIGTHFLGQNPNSTYPAGPNTGYSGKVPAKSYLSIQKTLPVGKKIILKTHTSELRMPDFNTDENKELKLWYDEPAPTGNDNLAEQLSDADNIPNDGWEKWALPIGNSYMGAMVFGRTTTERIQITENSLSNPYRSDKGGRGGLNNFAEVYLDFNHPDPTNYQRDLDIKNAVAGVNYTYNGVNYSREYFTSYPDKVMAVKLSASAGGNVSFTLRPEIPYIKNYGGKPGDGQGKSGTVTAAGDTITLSGKMEYYNILFEGQLKVIPQGGTMTASEDTIAVDGADSAVILMAVGTNYSMESKTFTEPDPKRKLSGNPAPHDKVQGILTAAAAKTYDEIKQAHIADYQTYFNRVNLNLGAPFPANLTTDQLLADYKNGKSNSYLEELYFQFGRYLLIASSRKGGYPANLQGTWNRYDSSPWSSGYWHNINVQMNYWPAFNTNLAEMFEPYVDYNKAYMDLAEQGATKYVTNYFPEKLDATNGNGWGIGTGGYLYTVEAPPTGGHSGPGTSALTTKLFWDYYDFTRDDTILQNDVFAPLSGVSRFLSKAVEPMDGFYLTKYSASPEQQKDGKHYRTVGCAFDQQLIYDNHKDTLAAANILGIENDLTATIQEQIDKLDPVQVGKSGQVKEYREENYYGEIGAKQYKHISQLMGLYPGNIINHETPAWLDAARVTMVNRGDQSTGWAMAHRVNLWARLSDGNKAYSLYQTLLKTGTATNLWDMHPPFQIDGNFGGTAGVAEMLLQSHEGYISMLPALPDAWSAGSFDGLVARGNFEVSAKWNRGQATEFVITSNKGNHCQVKFHNLAAAQVKTTSGEQVKVTVVNNDLIAFPTEAGKSYLITNIPTYEKLQKPSSVTVTGDKAVNISWGAVTNAASYNVYMALESAPDYVLIGNASTNAISYTPNAEERYRQTTYKVVPVNSAGQEGEGATKLVEERALPFPTSVGCKNTIEGALEINFAPVDGATAYNIYKTVNGTKEKVGQTVSATYVVEQPDADAQYSVSAVCGAQESAASKVQAAGELVNVALGKPIMCPTIPKPIFPFSNALDGDETTRFAISDQTTPFEVEIDLQGSFDLTSIIFTEFKEANKLTRSDQTTVSLYHNGAWEVVINAQTLNNIDPNGAATTFDLKSKTAEKVKVKFAHTSGQKKSASIWEIKCMASVMNYETVKADLFRVANLMEQADVSELSQEDAVALQLANRRATELLNGQSVTQPDVDEATLSLQALLAKTPFVVRNILVPGGIKLQQDAGAARGSAYVTNLNGTATNVVLFTAAYEGDILKEIKVDKKTLEPGAKVLFENTLFINERQTVKQYLWQDGTLVPIQ